MGRPPGGKGSPLLPLCRNDQRQDDKDCHVVDHVAVCHFSDQGRYMTKRKLKLRYHAGFEVYLEKTLESFIADL